MSGQPRAALPLVDAREAAGPTPSVQVMTVTPVPAPTDPSDPNWVTPDVAARFQALACPDPAPEAVPDPSRPLVACSADGGAKYVLGPAELDQTNLQAGGSRAENVNGSWVVLVTFKDTSAGRLAAITDRLSHQPLGRNQLGIVLDGRVVSAPIVQTHIDGAELQITGNFTQSDARRLAQSIR